MYNPNGLIRIKKESFAIRCEICHQADCFDPRENYCSRCQFMSLIPIETKSIHISRVSYLVYLLLNLSITTISYGLLQTFHPILRHENIFLFFFPMTAITACLFPLNYRYLINKATLGRKIAVFYSTFLIALVLYGMYLCLYSQLPSISINSGIGTIILFELFVIVVGHIFGLPTLIFMIFVNNYLKAFLFGEVEIKQGKFVIRP